jgi:hypothetical protein
MIEDTLLSAIRMLGLPMRGYLNGSPRFSRDLTGEESALFELIVSAHEQPLTSTECLALQAAITNEQWLAYQDVRKAPIRQAREARYRAETDALRMKADEDYTIGDSSWLAAIEVWKTAKAAIRTELPYED